MCETYEHELNAAGSAVARGAVEARFDDWWQSIGSDPKKARPTLMPGDRHDLWRRGWLLALAQLNQLLTLHRGAEPEPIEADADLMFADFLEAMAAGE